MNEAVLAGYLARADEWEAQGSKYAAATVRDLVQEVRRLDHMLDGTLRKLDDVLSHSTATANNLAECAVVLAENTVVLDGEDWIPEVKSFKRAVSQFLLERDG